MGDDILKFKLIGGEQGDKARHCSEDGQTPSEEEDRCRLSETRFFCLKEPKDDRDCKESYRSDHQIITSLAGKKRPSWSVG